VSFTSGAGGLVSTMAGPDGVGAVWPTIAHGFAYPSRTPRRPGGPQLAAWAPHCGQAEPVKDSCTLLTCTTNAWT